jgi:hypothetical protein
LSKQQDAPDVLGALKKMIMGERDSPHYKSSPNAWYCVQHEHRTHFIQVAWWSTLHHPVEDMQPPEGNKHMFPWWVSGT